MFIFNEKTARLFRRLEKIPRLGDVFVGNLIDKDEYGLGGLVGFFADHLSDTFADVLFLFLGEGSGNPNIYIGHDNSLRYDVCVGWNEKAIVSSADH
jgi:hypothetical protein